MKSFSVRNGRRIFSFGEVTIKTWGDSIEEVLIKQRPLKQVISSLLSHTQVKTHPFNREVVEVIFCDRGEVYKLLSSVFNAVNGLEKEKEPWLASLLASLFYGDFTGLWIYFLLNNQYGLAISLWHKILSITEEWEARQGTSIHKGTPYYFLAETYLLSGDLDSAFTCLYSALEEDKILGEKCPESGYPGKGPAYLTVSLIDDENNHMYPLVCKIRRFIHEHLDKYNRSLDRKFTIEEFDEKFLKNQDLESEKFFFTYNMWILVNLKENLKKLWPELLDNDFSILDNDFSRLRNLDLIFNLCLIIDKTLAHRYRPSNVSTWFISDNIKEICEDRGWMKKRDLDQFLGELKTRGIYVSGGESDDVKKSISALLDMKESYKGKPVKKEVFYMLTVWKLRNLGGHEIKNLPILAKRFNEILSTLMGALFLAVEALTY